MIDETSVVLRGEKNAGIIQAICEIYNLSQEEATDIFYRSETASMIEDKIADLHCRSDKYLASLIMDEHNPKMTLL